MTADLKKALIRYLISAVVFVIFLVHSAGWRPYGLLTEIENFAYDARVVLTMPGTIDQNLVIVDLDEKSLAAEGWPWSRDKWGALIVQLFDRYQVRVAGFDILFSEPDQTSGGVLLQRLAAAELADLPGYAERVPALAASLDNDRKFAAALRGRNVVLGYVFQVGEGISKGRLGPELLKPGPAGLDQLDYVLAKSYLGNLEALQDATGQGGFFDNPLEDDDGVFRRVPLVEKHGDAIYPSLALSMVRAAQGGTDVLFEFDPPDARGPLNLERMRIGELSVPVDERVAVMVPYRGRQYSFPYVSATDVLHGTADPATLRGTMALIGTSAAGLLDLRTTPVGKAYAGVEVHANLISGMIEGRVKQKAPYYRGIEVVTLFIIALLMAAIFPRVSPLASAAVGLALVGAGLGLGFAMWSQANFIMPMGVPVAFTLAVFLAQLLFGYFIESRRAREIERNFGEYVPPEVVAEMAERGGQISMEGISREMTVLFSDVRGFTTISEQFKDRPQELSELMNHFLTPLTKVIQKHRGTIDKYMGDAIMAFWGAPLEDPQHAQHALNAALELPQALRALDESFAKRGWPALQIGVGLSSGNMRVGNMGSEFRRAYTVMGDPVNLGSRVEGLTKEYGAVVMCSEFTRNLAPSDWSFRELDVVRVKGKNEPVAIYEPLGPKDALDPQLRQDLARHRGALRLYRAQQWDQAENEFFNLSRSAFKHPVYTMFLERIGFLRANPPGANWDGAFTFTHK